LIDYDNLIMEEWLWKQLYIWKCLLINMEII
jgi:hypothetical protein